MEAKASLSLLIKDIIAVNLHKKLAKTIRTYHTHPDKLFQHTNVDKSMK
jgi:hypothetical protein